MCFNVATLKNYSKLLVAYYAGLIILWVRDLGRAQLSSLSLILEASAGEAGTGRSTARMASSLTYLVAPCILSLSLSLWVSHSPGSPELLVAWQPWGSHAFLRGVSALQVWAFQESQRLFTSVLEVTSYEPSKSLRTTQSQREGMNPYSSMGEMSKNLCHLYSFTPFLCTEGESTPTWGFHIMDKSVSCIQNEGRSQVTLEQRHQFEVRHSQLRDHIYHWLGDLELNLTESQGVWGLHGGVLSVEWNNGMFQGYCVDT